MPRLHICSLALIGDTVAQTGARSLVTLLSPGTAVSRPAESRPSAIFISQFQTSSRPCPVRFCRTPRISMSSFGFICDWDRAEPMVIHCFAGVSRSTAAAYIAACALSPKRDEFVVARGLRAASPTATPNARLVALADSALQRGGRMNEAIAAIGRGEECFEGTPFTLELA